jgi:hypothetical protein
MKSEIKLCIKHILPYAIVTSIIIALTISNFDVAGIGNTVILIMFSVFMVLVTVSKVMKVDRIINKRIPNDTQDAE